MKSIWMKNSAFWSAFFFGMAAPTTIYQINTYSYPHDSELDAMRNDWVKVGADLNKAIDLGNVEARS